MSTPTPPAFGSRWDTVRDWLVNQFGGKADTGHHHDSRYVRTVNGLGPDGAGNVVVEGGGGGGDYPTGVAITDQQAIGIYQITEGDPVPPGAPVGSVVLTVEA